MGQSAVKFESGCEGLIYIPYLMGERTPHLDPFAKGMFLEISARHSNFPAAILSLIVIILLSFL